ncbi:MAG: EAL domain-containing protein [Pseudomonadota bacterium]
MKIREEYEYNLTWGTKLKYAIKEDRLVPYFQPIANNNDDSIQKFECLVRLIEEDGSAITPGVFLGVAKKFKLSPDITRIMIEKSLLVLKDSDYEISLNLSYEDIIDTETTDFIKANLQEREIAERVTFELLESESIANYEQVHLFIQDIKALGCHISIDDFGTGYSNFEHILRLNVDFIKIDGSLIKELDTDDNAYVVTRSIVNFAKELDIRTTAEWVHSQSVLEKVKSLGVDYAQGFYIGEPAPTPSKIPKYETSE